MKKIVYAILATVSGLVLLFSYRTSLGQAAPVAVGTTGPVPSAAAPSGGDGSDGNGSAGSTGTTGGGPTAAPQAAGTLKDGTFTGREASTPYGPMQVAITVSGGRISRVDVPEYPTATGRDQRINAVAVPQLVSETMSAQSAHIDMVTGATYTSDGYLQSLQSAIDEASS